MQIVRHFGVEPYSPPRILTERHSIRPRGIRQATRLILPAGAAENERPASHRYRQRRAVGHGGAAGVHRTIEGGTLVAARRTGEPKLTIGDRLLTALMGFLVAFLTMCLVWLLTLQFWFVATDRPLPFHWTWIVALVAAVAGFLIGPERMMNGFRILWAAIGAILNRPNRD